MNIKSTGLKKKSKKKYIYIITLCVLMIIFALITWRSSIKKVTVLVDGKEIVHKTNKDTIGEVLNELGIAYGENDKLSKGVSESINNKDNIIITRVTFKEEVVEEVIDFKEKKVNDYKIPLGENRILSEGELGKKNITYKITYENGVEVKRDLVKEEVINEASDKVIAEGIFDPTSLTVCVNKLRNLDSDYEPESLVVPNVRSIVSSSRIMMRQEAATALEDLFLGAENDGVYLYAVSGYRSYDYQASIYNPYSGYSAPPGASEHQLGLAMDLSTSYYGGELVTEFGYSVEGQWVKENAHKYGFIVRYLEGKEDITGYYYEPWHIRYVGVDLATELYNKGITLEEYYGEY